MYYSCISDTGEKGCTPSGTIVIGGKTVLHNGTMVPITSPLPVDSSTKAYMDDDKTRKQVGWLRHFTIPPNTP